MVRAKLKITTDILGVPVFIVFEISIPFFLDEFQNQNFCCLLVCGKCMNFGCSGSISILSEHSIV